MNKVDLAAPLHSWTCTLENFKAIVKFQANPIFDANLDEQKASAEEYWQKWDIFEEDDFRNGYEDYRIIALANQEYLENRKSGFTRETWTNVFWLLRNIKSIGFKDFHAAYAGFHNQTPDLNKRTIQSFACFSTGEEHKTIAASIGDALFETGIESLAEADLCIQSLEIHCAMTGHFGWENITGWGKLDLSSLQHFHFDPWVTSYRCCGEDEEPSEGQDAIAIRASDAITSIMKKCKDRLAEFYYSGEFCPMIWPGAQVIPLSNLKSLSLEYGYIEAKNLQQVRIDTSSFLP